MLRNYRVATGLLDSGVVLIRIGISRGVLVNVVKNIPVP
jgi:hypothetical protein